MAAHVVRDEDGFNLPPLSREEGTTYGWFDRWQVGTTPDGKYLTDFADWEARDLYEMLAKDYKARQMENVLTLPIVSAERTIVPVKGDTGQAEWIKAFWEQDHLNGGSRTSLDNIVDLMTSAFAYKRSYFEKVWRKGTGDYEGKIVYDDLAWRPQTTCRIMRDPHNGRFKGFEQEAYFIGMGVKSNLKTPWPIQIPAPRAFVYTHGQRRDPLNGMSDMEIAFWAWKTKQKILLLWFQFLQSVSLPKVVVKANDLGTARNIAGEIARMKASGVLPVSVPGGPDSVGIEPLDISGKGSEQFSEVITWLDNAATQSILAGFLNLTSRGMPMDGAGSFALSKDASDYFLQFEEAKAREMEQAIRTHLFAPLIRYNFGPKVSVPKFQFEPLNEIDKATAVTLLTAAMAAPAGGPTPVSFVAGLAEQVAQYLGLDGSQMKDDFTNSFNAAAAAAAEKAAQATPMGGTPLGQGVAAIGGAVSAATAAVKGGKEPNTKGKKTTQVNGLGRQSPPPGSGVAPDPTKPVPLPPQAKAALEAKQAKQPTGKGATNAQVPSKRTRS